MCSTPTRPSASCSAPRNPRSSLSQQQSCSSLDRMSGLSPQHRQSGATAAFDVSEGKKKGGVVKAFPIKLHDMLDAASGDGIADIVSWQVHGRCFVVRDHKRFASEVMPLYFKQTKFASFQRQLNLYGFQRFTQGRDKNGYYHELFLRGQRHLCGSMIRLKVKGTKVRKATQPDKQPDLYAMPPLPVVQVARTRQLSMSKRMSASSLVQVESDSDSSSGGDRVKIFTTPPLRPLPAPRPGFLPLHPLPTGFPALPPTATAPPSLPAIVTPPMVRSFVRAPSSIPPLPPLLATSGSSSVSLSSIGNAATASDTTGISDEITSTTAVASSWPILPEDVSDLSPQTVDFLTALYDIEREVPPLPGVGDVSSLSSKTEEFSPACPNEEIVYFEGRPFYYIEDSKEIPI